MHHFSTYWRAVFAPVQKKAWDLLLVSMLHQRSVVQTCKTRSRQQNQKQHEPNLLLTKSKLVDTVPRSKNKRQD